MRSGPRWTDSSVPWAMCTPGEGASGEELVRAGLVAMGRGERSIEALLVAVGAPPATGARHRGAGGRASVAPSGAGTLSRHRTGPSRRCPLPAPCPDPATGELRARARTPSFLRVAPPRAGLGFDDAPMITLHHRRTPCGLRRRQQAHRPCSAHRRRGSASRTSSPVSADRAYTSSPPFPSGSPRWQRDRVHRDGTGAVGPATPRRCAGKPGMRDAG